jgi:hypothetical protein
MLIPPRRTKFSGKGLKGLVEKEKTNQQLNWLLRTTRRGAGPCLSKARILSEVHL